MAAGAIESSGHASPAYGAARRAIMKARRNGRPLRLGLRPDSLVERERPPVGMQAKDLVAGRAKKHPDELHYPVRRP